MKTVLVSGSAGKMGEAVCRLLRQFYPEVEIWGLDRNPHPHVDRCVSLKELKEKMPRVVIDFSQPPLFRKLLPLVVENQCRLVSGTTGLQKKDFQAIKKASQKTAVLWSANMSFGVVLLKQALQSLSQLPDADFSIEDYHHRYKVDAPSGTAKVLQETLKEQGVKPEVFSVRAGGIYGVHNVSAVNDEEEVIFTHRALNRDVFAKGAIRCAQWLQKKKRGQFQIEDVVLSR